MKKLLLLVLLLFTLSSCTLFEENVEKKDFLEVFNNSLIYPFGICGVYEECEYYNGELSYNYMMADYTNVTIFPDDTNDIVDIYLAVTSLKSVGRIVGEIPSVAYEFSRNYLGVAGYTCKRVVISSSKVKLNNLDFNNYFDNEDKINDYLSKTFGFTYSERLSNSDKAVYELAFDTFGIQVVFYDGYWEVIRCLLP